MKKLFIPLSVAGAILLTGCGISSKKEMSPSELINTNLYNECIKMNKCEQFPKKPTLYKYGIKTPIKPPVVKSIIGKGKVYIYGDQFSEKNNPYIEMFATNKIDRVTFYAPKIEEFHNLLLQVKKDWNLIPNNTEKEYKTKIEKRTTQIIIKMKNKNNIKKAVIVFMGKHLVNKVNILIDFDRLNLLISNIDKVNSKLENKYVPCIEKCYKSVKEAYTE